MDVEAEVAGEVNVSTVTALIHQLDNPSTLLVGESPKHGGRLVLPGGKIEITDEADRGNRGLSTLRREVPEEVGAKVWSSRYIGKAVDPTRDVRRKSVGELDGVTTSPPISTFRTGAGDTSLLLAHYGNPDYLYVCTVDEAAVRSSDELHNVRFEDVETLVRGEFAAGHDVLVLWYREMQAQRWESLPPEALVSFLEDRRRLRRTG
jgi:8-oxo-dGTP pyrophosphatase MutT (NUDIX family)